MAFGRALGMAGKAIMPGKSGGGAMSAVKSKIGLGPQAPPSPGMSPQAMQNIGGVAGRFGGMERPMPMQGPPLAPPSGEMMQAQGPPPMQQAMGPNMGMRRPMPVPIQQGPDMSDPMQQQKMQQMMAQRRGLGPSMRPQY